MTERLTRDTWIQHGFDVLRYQGHEQLKADRMARALGVSRGSFYWHFPSLQDFHDALLKTWRAENTLEVISQLETLPDAHSKVATLIQMGIDMPQPLENGMRRWGGVNADVAKALAEIDQIRATYLTQVFESEGLAPHIAQDRAILLSFAAIGRAFAPNLADQTSATAGQTLGAIFFTMPQEDLSDEDNSPDT